MSTRNASRRLASILLCAGALAPLGGCATGPDIRRIEHPELPIERFGFVFYPPAQGTWSIAEMSESERTQIVLLRDYDPDRASNEMEPMVMIQVMIARIPPSVFSEMFSDQHDALEKLAGGAAQPSSGRFKDLVCETSWGQVQGQEVSRLVRRTEERDNPNAPSEVLTLEVLSTWIFHPTRPSTSIRLTFSGRAPQGQPLPPTAELEQEFLAKLAFN